MPKKGHCQNVVWFYVGVSKLLVDVTWSCFSLLAARIAFRRIRGLRLQFLATRICEGGCAKHFCDALPSDSHLCEVRRATSARFQSHLCEVRKLPLRGSKGYLCEVGKLPLRGPKAHLCEVGKLPLRGRKVTSARCRKTHLCGAFFVKMNGVAPSKLPLRGPGGYLCEVRKATPARLEKATSARFERPPLRGPQGYLCEVQNITSERWGKYSNVVPRRT